MEKITNYTNYKQQHPEEYRKILECIWDFLDNHPNVSDEDLKNFLNAEDGESIEAYGVITRKAASIYNYPVKSADVLWVYNEAYMNGDLDKRDINDVGLNYGKTTKWLPDPYEAKRVNELFYGDTKYRAGSNQIGFLDSMVGIPGHPFPDGSRSRAGFMRSIGYPIRAVTANEYFTNNKRKRCKGDGPWLIFYKLKEKVIDIKSNSGLQATEGVKMNNIGKGKNKGMYSFESHDEDLSGFEGMSRENIGSFQAKVAQKIEEVGALSVLKAIMDNSSEYGSYYLDEIDTILNTTDLTNSQDVLERLVNTTETLLDDTQIELLTDSLDSLGEYEKDEEADTDYSYKEGEEYEEPDDWSSVDDGYDDYEDENGPGVPVEEVGGEEEEAHESLDDSGEYDEFNEKHRDEWMERHPHGWYNNESDYGTGDEEGESRDSATESAEGSELEQLKQWFASTFKKDEDGYPNENSKDDISNELDEAYEYGIDEGNLEEYNEYKLTTPLTGQVEAEEHIRKMERLYDLLNGGGVVDESSATEEIHLGGTQRGITLDEFLSLVKAQKVSDLGELQYRVIDEWKEGNERPIDTLRKITTTGQARDAYWREQTAGKWEMFLQIGKALGLKTPQEIVNFYSKNKKEGEDLLQTLSRIALYGNKKERL